MAEAPDGQTYVDTDDTVTVHIYIYLVQLVHDDNLLIHVLYIHIYKTYIVYILITYSMMQFGSSAQTPNSMNCDIAALLPCGIRFWKLCNTAK